MSFGLEAAEHWLFGFLKGAAEKIELDVLALDANVKSSALALLDPHVGEWAGKMSTWLMPGDPYDVQDVTSTAQWSIGGKFLQRTFSGRFLGKPFEAVCFIGHDDGAGQYVAAWMDSATTSMMPMKGGRDRDTQTLTLDGTIRLIDVTGTHLDVRTILRMEDEDHFLCEISLGRLGIYVKAHEIDLTRVTPP
jgi:hypothetical protein